MNGLRKILSVVLLVLIHTSLYAQTNYSVSGVIKDAGAGESLIGVSVRFTGKAEISTGTNAYGFYSARLAPGDYTMTVSYVGYKTLARMIRVSENQRLDIALTLNTLLSEVVISGERRNQNVSDAQMGLAKVNLAEVKNVPVLFGERDILKTIQLLPGIKPAGEGNSGFYVRGGSSDHNLILLDEATVYNASHLLGFFSTFNSDAIKDVTVFKGGMPAEYGGRLASVLDIKMNDGNRKDHTAEGGIGLISSRLKVEGPLVKDKSSFMVSGRRTYADAFLALSSDTTINDNTIYFYDLNAKVNFQINDKNVLYLSGYFGRDELGLARTFAFDWGNSTATLRWSSLVNSRLFSGTSVIYSNYDYSIENFLEENGFRVRSGIRNFNLKQDFQYTAGSRHDLKFGINAIHHTIMPGRIDSDESSSVNNIAIENRKGLEIAAYVSDEWEVNGRLRLVYGLRLTDFLSLGPGLFRSYDAEGNTVSSREYRDYEVVKNYLTPEPRISASYSLNPASSVKASYTRNSQNLHLMSNSTAASPTDLYIMNSNTVRPEIADQFAAGYFRNFRDDLYEFSAEVYYKWMQNQIEYRSGTDLRGNSNVEADLLFGDGRSYGLELLLKKRSGKFSGWVGYTLSKTERRFDQISEGNWFLAKQDRTHDLSLVGIYRLNPRWTFSSTFVFNTGNAVTFPAGKYVLNGETVFYYADRNSDRMPDYHRLDLSATLEAKPGKKLQSSWSFGIYNVYNRQNAFLIDFEEDPADPAKTRAVRTSLFGIIPSVTWNFKF